VELSGGGSQKMGMNELKNSKNKKEKNLTKITNY
jgi:hypothetical protein